MDYITDPRKNAKIQALHWDIIDEGHPAYSVDYFVSMETKLGMRKASAEAPVLEEHEDEPAPRSRSMVSAPVSRDGVPSSSGEKPGQVRLTAMQKEAAKIAGITEKEYAEQVLRLRGEKLNGNYGGQP
jgi:hypothetical protein